MPKNLLPHVVHGLLPDALHDADLYVLRQKIKKQNQQVDQADEHQPAPGRRQVDAPAEIAGVR